MPWQPELALGAVVDGADPQVIINDILAAELAIDQNYFRRETVRQREEIERRRKVYLGDRTPVPLAGRTVIVVDDGIATGSTVRTAPRAIGRAGAGKIVLAVPVAPEDALEELRNGTKSRGFTFPIGRCGDTLYSAPSRRLAGLVSFGKRVCATTQRLSVSEISSGALKTLVRAQ